MTYFRVYPDTQGYWRWKLVAANGEPIAVSSESYNTEYGARAAVRWVKSHAPVSVEL